jgi:serine protease Do
MIGRGSGFFLHPGDKLVTNNHVIDKADHVVIETYWRRKIRIDKVLVRDSECDLAILPVPASFDPETLKLADRAHSVGESVFALGSPKHTRFGISQGLIVQLSSSFAVNHSKLAR